jgi:hypothetical protein
VDWIGLTSGLLWVLGLAICLAALSMARYLSHTSDAPALGSLKQAGLQLALSVGLALFFIGLLLGSDPWWERGAWGLGAAGCIVWAVRAWRGHHVADEKRE